MPVTLTADRVFVDVRVNGGDPRPFLLDSGASSSVLNADRLAELGLTASGSLSADVEGGTVEASHVANASLHVGATTLPPREVAALSLAGVEAGLGRKLYGIIGGEWFARHRVTIDTVRAQVTLDAPVPRATPVAISIEDGTPIVVAWVANVEGRFQLDTGGGIMTIYAPFLTAHPELVPANIVQVTSGAMLPGQLRSGIGRAASLRIGEVVLDAPIVNFSQAASGDRVGVDAGLIGSDVLRRFTVTFDYASRRAWLVPNARFSERFEFAMSGTSFYAEGEEIRVRSVIAGGPADEAGLRAGDRVLAVDGKVRTLEELRQLFLVPGKTYEIQTESRTLRLTTRRLI